MTTTQTSEGEHMRTTISIEREGQFHVGWTHTHAHQCGNVGTPILQFRVKVTGTPAGLNKQGWLIDNNSIPSYFAKKYERVSDFLSCEHIAHQACVDLAAQVKAEGAHATSVKVSVSGIPGSWITSECVDD